MLTLTTQSGYQQASWQAHDNRQRLFAALLAALITLWLALQFNHRSTSHLTGDAPTKPFTLLTLTFAPTFPNKAVTPGRLAKPASSPSITKPKRDNPTRQGIETSAIATIEPKSISDAPQAIQAFSAALDSPLQIDRKAISKAYYDSKSEIQKMAEASGKELNSPVKTKYEKYQTAAAEAAIPDCLGPQGPGGLGLLAIPVIAFSAATGKCK